MSEATEEAVRENSNLPDGWELKRLGEIGEPVIGLTYSPSNVKRDGLLVLRSSNVNDGALVYEDNVFVDLKVPSKLVLREDDLLICVRNGSRPLIGKSALIDKTAAGMTFGAFMSVFRSPHNRFVFQCFQSRLVKQQIDAHLGATINQITNKSLRSFKIPFPPPEERAAIVQALTDADSLIGALAGLIEKKRAMKLGAMQALLTGRQRLPGFAGNWKEMRFGEVLRVRHGQSQAAVASESGTYPIMASGGEIGRATRFLYDKPSVLIGRKGTIDSPQFIDTPFWSIDTLFYTEIGPGVDARFIFYRFLMVDWKSLNEASGVPSLSASNIEAQSFHCPDSDEQRAIAAVLSDFDGEIEKLIDRLQKAREVKEGMAQQLLTGQIRLSSTGDAA